MNKHKAEILYFIPFITAATQKSTPTRTKKSSSSSSSSRSSESGAQSDHESDSSTPASARKTSRTIVSMRRPSIMAAAALKSQHYGSFYLRMGAVGNYTFTTF
jgi:hypothetical protein